jgi:hypothetical protein
VAMVVALSNRQAIKKKSSNKMKFAILLSSTLVFTQTVLAHTFLASPKSAVRTGFGQNCQNGNNNNPCCADKSSAKPSQTVYARNGKFEFAWPRNNHPGGFIRMAMVPLSESGSQAAFDGN